MPGREGGRHCWAALPGCPFEGRPEVLTGGCLCGAVRYEAAAPPFHSTLCHCADCRRAAGAGPVAWFTVPRDAFRFVGGAPVAYASSPGVTRRFCGACGTSLTFEAVPGEVDVTTCSLDDPGLVPPGDHTQAAGRLPWDALGDGLPVFPGGRTPG